MSPRPPQTPDFANRNTYIPSSTQQALSRQLQQSAPAHLKQYLSADQPSYVPPRIQQELTAHMEKALPTHLKQYAGAYVEQNIVDPSLRRPLSSHSTTVAHAPLPTRGNQSHSGNIPGEQPKAQFLNNLFQADALSSKPPQPMTTVSPESYDQPRQAAPPPISQVAIPGHDPLVIAPNQPLSPQSQPALDHSPYEFIMNPHKGHKPAGPLIGGSTTKRLLIFASGIIILIIAAVIVSSLFKGGGPNTTPIVTVVQEQTELVRVATEGTTTSTDATTQAFAYSVELSASSASQQLTKYMSGIKETISPKVLGLKQSAAVDTELKNAQTNNTYDSTLVKVLQADLADYSAALKTAYTANPGPKGRQLLSSQYTGAQLLIQQGNQVDSAGGN